MLLRGQTALVAIVGQGLSVLGRRHAGLGYGAMGLYSTSGGLPVDRGLGIRRIAPLWRFVVGQVLGRPVHVGV